MGVGQQWLKGSPTDAIFLGVRSPQPRQRRTHLDRGTRRFARKRTGGRRCVLTLGPTFPTQGGYSVRGCLMFWALSSFSCLFKYIYISLSLSISFSLPLSLSFSVSLSLSLSLSCCYVFPLDLGSIDAASLPILVLRSGPRIACSVCP